MPSQKQQIIEILERYGRGALDGILDTAQHDNNVQNKGNDMLQGLVKKNLGWIIGGVAAFLTALYFVISRGSNPKRKNW